MKTHTLPSAPAIRLYQRLLMAFLCLLCLLLFQGLARASVTAQVDRDSVNEGETFTLDLNVSGSNSSQPDLSPLHQDFDVLGTGQKSMIQIINGDVQSTHAWSITLSPKHSGTLTIPPISVGNAQSNPLSITVMPAGASTSGNGNQGDVFIEVSAKPDKAYVQSQLLYTVRLYYATALRQGSLSKPSLDNAIVQKLGDDSNYATMRDGRRYQVIERRYAIFPQRSGKLEIPAVVFDGAVNDPSAQTGDPFFDSFNPATRQVHLRSRKLDIDVTPQPANYQGASWLPAQEITLEEKWSPQHPQFRVGEPVTRSIIIHARGLSASQLPDLAMDNIKDFKLYPDQAQAQDTPQGNTLTSTREQKIAMIPTRTGELTLPGLHLTWWDTTTRQQRTATLPAETIHVLPAVAGASPAPVNTGTAATQSTPTQTQTAPPSTVETPTTHPGSTATSDNSTSYLWIATSVFFALAWLITLLLWWRRKQPGPTKTTPAITAVPREDTVKPVRQACRQTDPQALKRALLAWGGQRWRTNPPLSLGELAARVNDHALAEDIATLDKWLYAANTTDWHAETLLHNFNTYLKQTDAQTTANTTSSLAPLHLHKARASAK